MIARVVAALCVCTLLFACGEEPTADSPTKHDPQALSNRLDFVRTTDSAVVTIFSDKCGLLENLTVAYIVVFERLGTVSQTKKVCAIKSGLPPAPDDLLVNSITLVESDGTKMGEPILRLTAFDGDYFSSQELNTSGSVESAEGTFLIEPKRLFAIGGYVSQQELTIGLPKGRHSHIALSTQDCPATPGWKLGKVLRGSKDPWAICWRLDKTRQIVELGYLDTTFVDTKKPMGFGFGIDQRKLERIDIGAFYKIDSLASRPTKATFE